MEEERREPPTSDLDHDPGVDPERAALEDAAEEQAEQESAAFEEELARHIHPAKSWLFASILLTLFIALISSIMSDSSMLMALIGFTPAILAALIFIGLLEGEYQDILFWLVPLALGFLFFAIGTAAGGLFDQLDMPVLTAVNILLGYLILAVMSVIEYQGGPDDASLADVEQFKPEKLDQYIHTIEDKCKAINFVIGRVYRVSHGGTKEMRNAIKVPSEWYNEFNSIQPEDLKEQKEAAIDLLTRIQERLRVLLSPEKAVFSPLEVKGLKHLARDPAGKDRVLDVLSVNDQDPVEDYFLGAMDFCKRVLTELEKL